MFTYRVYRTLSVVACEYMTVWSEKERASCSLVASGVGRAFKRARFRPNLAAISLLFHHVR